MEKYLKILYDETSYVTLNNNNLTLNSKYKLGKITISNNSATLQLLFQSSQKIYIDFDKLYGANENDIVLVQVIFNPKGKTKAKVIKILEKSDTKFLAYVKENKLFSLKYNIYIENIKDYKNGDILEIKNQSNKLIGNINDPQIDEIISLNIYNQQYRLNSFPKISFKTDNKSRINLTNLDFCTIDPVSAKDFDDAIYFDENNSTLYVAIADVSAYIQENSSLDQEAKKRAFSIYFPHKVIPMLPFELSNNLCSLVPNEPRLAYTFKIKLDLKNIKVISSELFEATIESKNRYSYDQIDKILKANDRSNYFVKLYNITKKFRVKRLTKGFDFRNDEIRLKLDNDQNLLSTSIESSTPSHSLIEECMLLANCEAAKRLKQIGIFRVHDQPSQSNIIKLIDEVKSLGIKAKLKSNVHDTIEYIQKKAKNINLQEEIDTLIIQSQQQASYSSIKKEHFGLGFSDYSHFTSPIRRYADLVLHRILKTKRIPKDIETICDNISDIERQIASLVWDFEDRKYSRWANKNLNKTFKAKIVDSEKGIAFIDDDLTGARVKLGNYAGQKLFSKIRVKLESSDIITKEIIARII